MNVDFTNKQEYYYGDTRLEFNIEDKVLFRDVTDCPLYYLLNGKCFVKLYLFEIFMFNKLCFVNKYKKSVVIKHLVVFIYTIY